MVNMDLFKFLMLVQAWLALNENFNLELVVLESYEGNVNKVYVMILNVTDGDFVGPPDIRNISVVKKIFQKYPIDQMRFLRLQYNELLVPENGDCFIEKYWVVFYKAAMDVEANLV